MILYVNGDSHSAGAEAVNPHCFAEDDPKFSTLGRSPHPDNLKVSYGQLLANSLDARLDIDAESASSNERIIRTTKEYLTHTQPDLIIIGWATWEREEFQVDNIYYQFSAGLRNLEWPEHVQKLYYTWVLHADPVKRVAYWHQQIWDFHLKLEKLGIKHVFFNTYHSFNHSFLPRYSWGDSYIGPYEHDMAYYYWLENNNYIPVNNSYHYGPDAHRAWAKYLLTYITEESIITT